MRTLLRLLVVATSVLAASPSTAAHADVAFDAAYIDRLMYAVPLAEFVSIVSRGDPWFDTTTDWCSAPLVGSTGRSFDFRASCRRHDFGYRNLKLLDRRYGGGHWNSWSRQRVDTQFRTDMKAHCRGRAWYDQPTCLAWAETFYTAVRTFGGP